MGVASRDKRLELLVIQPTPFCNLDCEYCYLPHRTSTARIAPETLERVFQQVLPSAEARNGFTVIWHAGEPLVLPPSFYRDSFALVDRLNVAHVPVSHAFQTNGVLLSSEWCSVIRDHGVRIGVSVDGPAFLHDEKRRTRSGKGTHAGVMRGIECLLRHAIDFHVITVLTSRALDHPDELFQFYVSSGIRRVGFNIEEIEGVNHRSSLNSRVAAAKVRVFMRRFLALAAESAAPLEIREQAGFRRFVWEHRGYLTGNQENTPLSIVSIDCHGRVSAFSPELLGIRSEKYGDFIVGDIVREDWETLIDSPVFERMASDVALGVERCRSTCRYFGVCGGGSPSNKFFETGSFDSTETMHCRLHTQAIVDVLLEVEEQTVRHL